MARRSFLNFKAPIVVKAPSLPKSDEDESSLEFAEVEDVPPVAFRPAPAIAPPKIPLLKEMAAVFVSFIAVLTFTGGLFWFIVALGSDTTVETSRDTRIHNQGLMHQREVGVIGSGIVMGLSVLTLGFNSLRISAARTDVAIAKLTASIERRRQ